MDEIKTVSETEPAAQGDLFFLPIDALPSDVQEVPRKDGQIYLSVSSLGHHHLAESPTAKAYQGSDPLITYVVAPDGFKARHIGDHKQIQFPVGIRAVYKQVEGTRPVAD